LRPSYDKAEPFVQAVICVDQRGENVRSRIRGRGNRQAATPQEEKHFLDSGELAASELLVGRFERTFKRPSAVAEAKVERL
jgi:hypothetical protein